MRTTTAARSLGRRSGARGTTAAASSATAPPTSASVHRVIAWPGSGSRVTTMIDCTAAWVTNRPLESSRNAADIASATISAELPPPGAECQHEQVGANTPTATPT